MKINRKYYYVYKAITCFLSFALIIMTCAVPVNAEVENVETTPSRIALSSLEETIDSYVATNQKNTAAVSVVAIKNGETIVNKAYGYADLEQQRKADTSTVFEWGSTSKLLVWTSVMKLVEQGKLDLETDIQEYLPEGFLKKLEYDAPITLMNLMHHNAGWEDRLIDLWYSSESDIVELGEALQKFEPRQIDKPGSVVAYSNYGTAMAAYIVEVQSGQPFYKYVNEHIFKPLNMKDTSIHPSQYDNLNVLKRRNEIQGYTTNLKLIPKNRAYISLYPAAGAIGTAEDAAKFLAALMPVDRSNLLFTNKDTLEEMLSTSLYYDGTSTPRIAHGFFEVEYWVPALEHAGSTAGFTSKFVFDPESNFGFVVMTNQSNEMVYNVGLVQKVFGSSFSTNSVESESGGYYMPARRVVSGFTKAYSMLSLQKYTTFDLSNFANVVERNGTVEKVSISYNDFLPVSNLTINLIKASCIALPVAILLSLRAIIGYFIRLSKYRLKNWERPGTGFDKYHIAINIASLALILNTILLFMRALGFSPYSSLRIHLILNLVYVILAVAYLVLLFYKLLKRSYSKKQKAVYIMSGMSAFLFAAFIMGWDLYF
ncbi:class A beta-lactamase-related serine hydrolase [Paenibacillus amylolyticus]|uniref:serine hydrolase domain-containing protein n=1 Tax=Paenibacillus amylolyticus TaxID=1451 RepID=UPI00105A930C|nr:serine hydrolase domain-containing protein [Paenibacillus amylolyticus]TDL69491.1 class A beta-lactamase-related serine hydrolase [Paenibacillus amylolyticus]